MKYHNTIIHKKHVCVNFYKFYDTVLTYNDNNFTVTFTLVMTLNFDLDLKSEI